MKYFVKRILQTIIVLIGVTLVTFILLNVIPGDPVNIMLEKRADPDMIARVRHEMGLDRPLYVQYFDFLKNAIHGDFGVSYFEKVPVSQMIYKSFKVTVQLGLRALGFAIIFGLSIGILSAVNRGKAIDSILMTIAILGMSAPSFWVGVILQIIFGLKLGLFPISGINLPKALVLPTIALGTRFAASLSRLTRTNMLDVMGQDYIRTARAKGVRESIVVLKHGFKNASIPIVTFLGLTIKSILEGAILTETVFGIPGIGRLMIDSIMARDIPVIQGCTVYIAAVFVIVNLIIDLTYGLLDPRVRVSKGA